MKASAIGRTLAGFAILGAAISKLLGNPPPPPEQFRYWLGLAVFGALMISPETVLAAFKAVSPFAKKDAP